MELILAREKVYYEFRKYKRDDVKKCILRLTKDSDISIEEAYIELTNTIKLPHIDFPIYSPVSPPKSSPRGNWRSFLYFLRTHVKDVYVTENYYWDSTQKAFVGTFENNLLYFLRHLNTRFIALPITLETQAIRHQNMLIFDRKKKTYELFDPHGFDRLKHFRHKKLLKTLQKIVPSYKLIDEKIACPRISLQHFENFSKFFAELRIQHGMPQLGLCIAWSFFYTYIRLSNPDIDPKAIKLIIMDKLISQNEPIKFMTDFIEYTKVVDSSHISDCITFLKKYKLYSKDYDITKKKIDDYVSKNKLENLALGKKLRKCLRGIKYAEP